MTSRCSPGKPPWANHIAAFVWPFICPFSCPRLLAEVYCTVQMLNHLVSLASFYKGIPLQTLLCLVTVDGIVKTYIAVLDCLIDNLPGMRAGIKVKRLINGGVDSLYFVRITSPSGSSVLGILSGKKTLVMNDLRGSVWMRNTTSFLWGDI